MPCGTCTCPPHRALTNTITTRAREREREIGGGGRERDCPGRDLAMQAPWLEGDAAPNQNSCFFHCMSPLKKIISTISAAEPCAAVASTRGVEIGQEHEEKGGWADAGGRWRMAAQRKKRARREVARKKKKTARVRFGHGAGASTSQRRPLCIGNN